LSNNGKAQGFKTTESASLTRQQV